MKRSMLKVTFGLMIVATALTVFSCAHEKTSVQETGSATTSHESYIKGLQESKKIVAARVNGVEITMQALISKMNQIAPMYLSASHEQSPEMDEVIKEKALDILIFRELAVEEAVRQGMTIEPEMVDRTIEALKSELKSEDKYGEYLLMRGLTEESLRKTVEQDMLFNKIAEKEINQKTVGGIRGKRPEAIEARKLVWEGELRKDAKIEILDIKNVMPADVFKAPN